MNAIVLELNNIAIQDQKLPDQVMGELICHRGWKLLIIAIVPESGRPFAQ
jgi:hypothetical protein